MDMMGQMLKNMDNSTLKNMMKSTTGMDIDENQLASMKNMMNTENLSQMQNMMKNNQMPTQMPSQSSSTLPSTSSPP
jgi:hypothetical protein